MGSVPANEATKATVSRLARERGISEAEVVAEAVRALLDRDAGGADAPDEAAD